MSAAVKVALAGISGFGDSYLEALLARGRAWGADFVATVETAPQRCPRLHELAARGIPVLPNLESLFASHDDLELVMIATPIHQHAPQTIYALRHGVDVLCEKPLAGTLDDALRMQREQEKSQGFVAIGYQWSFSQAVQDLKRDVMSGLLGKPLRLRAMAFFPRVSAYFRRNDWAGRIATDAGDGVLDSPVNNATAHYLHNMLYVLGQTRETSAMPASVQAELYRANEIENYDTAAVRCRTADGADVLFYTTLATYVRRGPRLCYEFEHATVEFDAQDEKPDMVARFRDGRVKHYGNPNHDRSEKIRHCIEAVRTGVPVACGIPAALPHTFCVVAAQESVTEVAEFPRRLRQHVPLDGDLIVCIDGLETALLDCYARGILPAEHGQLAWSRPGTRVDLSQPQWSPRRKQPAAV